MIVWKALKFFLSSTFCFAAIWNNEGKYHYLKVWFERTQLTLDFQCGCKHLRTLYNIVPDCVNEFTNDIDKFGKIANWRSIQDCYDAKIWDFSYVFIYWDFPNGEYYKGLMQQLEDSKTEKSIKICGESYKQIITDHMDSLSLWLDLCIANNILLQNDRIRQVL